MLKKISSTFIFVLTFCCILTAQERTTFTYFQNDSIKLEMDFYKPAKSGKNLPLLIYVHGGGFASGGRDAGDPICKYLAAQGYAAASISYTLYMKDKNFSCDGVLLEKIKAIQFAVNQLWQATSYLISKNAELDIDTTKIFIAGSSAGAETILHAAFWDYKTMNIYTANLSPTFKYAGLIAGSGAIMDLNLIKKTNLIPVLMFHGTADKLVPYGTAAHHFCKTNASGWLMLFGSYSVYNHIISLGGSVSLVTYCGGGHEYSGELFDKDQRPVFDFMEQTLSHTHLQKHTIISTDKNKSETQDYNFCK